MTQQSPLWRRWLGIPDYLNTKGALIEVAWRIYSFLRYLPGRLWRLRFRFARWLVNSLCFATYWVISKPRRRTEVQSVLQFSIISHKPYMLSRELRRQGLKSEFFALNVPSKRGILDLGYDYGLPAALTPARRGLLEIFYLWTVLARYDVIHSHFKTLLSHTGWELKYLRRLGKVLVFHYRGCDIRHRSLNMRIQPVLNCCQECDYPVGACDTDYQRSQVAITTQYGNAFFVTTPDLRDFVPVASEHIPFIQPTGIDVDAIVPAPKQAEVFRVVTSSNHPGIDGVRFIRDAVDRLASAGRSIELIEVNQLPYREALAVYKSADVFVGKLRMGYYNNANIETMMLGVPNMSYIRDEYGSIAPDCPIINTRPEQVYDRLSYYLDHRDELHAIGARGPAFVRRHHDPATIVKTLIERYNAVFTGRPLPTQPGPDRPPKESALPGNLTTVEARK